MRLLALKLLSISTTRFASYLVRALIGRLSQAWKPDRETPSTSHIQLTEPNSHERFATGDAPELFGTHFKPNEARGSRGMAIPRGLEPRTC